MKLLPSYCDEMIKEILDALSDEDLDKAIDMIKMEYGGYTRKGFRDEIESSYEGAMGFILSTPQKRTKTYDDIWIISAISISALMYAKYMAEIAVITPAQMNQLAALDTTSKRRAAAAMVRVSYDKLLPPGRKDILKRLKKEVSDRESIALIKDWPRPTYV